MQAEAGAGDVVLVVRRGADRFNRGRFLAAQQLWEDALRVASDTDRGLLEGLVQLAGGMHLRTRRAATRGAVHLLSQALVLLDDYRPTSHGLDVEVLLTDFTAFVDWLKAVDRPHRVLDRLRIPVIR